MTDAPNPALHMLVTRRPSDGTATLGEMTIDGTHQCFTLEPARPIPAGTYQVTVNHSPKFGRDMPLLVGVPGYEGVRIHPGNSAPDTEGCLLVGETEATDWIGESRVAFDALFSRIVAGQGVGVTVEIVEGATA
jgi:hypothetical protein